MDTPCYRSSRRCLTTSVTAGAILPSASDCVHPTWSNHALAPVLVGVHRGPSECPRSSTRVAVRTVIGSPSQATACRGDGWARSTIVSAIPRHAVCGVAFTERDQHLDRHRVDPPIPFLSMPGLGIQRRPPRGLLTDLAPSFPSHSFDTDLRESTFTAVRLTITNLHRVPPPISKTPSATHLLHRRNVPPAE